MLTLRRAGVSLSAMTDAQPPKLNKIQQQIYDALSANPAGLDIFEIRKALGVNANQEQLGRRVRSLRSFYDVKTVRDGERHIYVLGAAVSGKDDEAISGRLRAEALNTAKGRCQMCGKTVSEDGIKLQVDHKIPRTWGGTTTSDNLWAICTDCNHGKQDHFASYDQDEMKELMSIPSVWERIAKLLKLHLNKPVPSHLIDFVANAREQQDDWKKRLRELRYQPIGLKITMSRARNAQGYTEVTYTLENWIDLPADHAKLIRDWEKRNKKQSGGGDDDAAADDRGLD